MKLNIYVEPQLFNMELKKIPWNTLSHSHNINKKKKETMKELPIPSLTLCIFPKINSKKKKPITKKHHENIAVSFFDSHRANIVSILLCQSINSCKKKKGKEKTIAHMKNPNACLSPIKRNDPNSNPNQNGQT